MSFELYAFPKYVPSILRIDVLNMMPYQEGYKNIETWMKRYYELPDEVTFQYCIYPNG